MNSAVTANAAGEVGVAYRYWQTSLHENGRYVGFKIRHNHLHAKSCVHLLVELKRNVDPTSRSDEAQFRLFVAPLDQRRLFKRGEC